MNPMTKIPFESTPALDAYHQVKIEAFTDAVERAASWSAAKAAWSAAGGVEKGEEHEEMQRLRKALDASSKAFTERLTTLAEKVSEELLRKYNRAWKAWYFRDENGRAASWCPEQVSPSGKYKLVVTSHATSPGCWDYSKGKVSEVSTSKVIAEVCRNYSAFPFSWVEEHKNGHDYLVAGQDYQGQTVIELDTGERVDYLPDAAKEGFGFCWADHAASPDGTLLAVNGCYWGAPYDGVIYDFSHPMSPPWPELFRSDDDGILGWEGDKCKVGQRRDAVNVPGHPLHGKAEWEMTVEELEVIEKLAKEQGKKEDDLYAPKETYKLWAPPPPLETARDYIIEILEWARGNKEQVVVNDYRAQIAAQIARLTKEDQGVLLAEQNVADLLAWMETAPREWKD